MRGKPPTDYFEMNLPYCLIADLVRKEMEAVSQHIQVRFEVSTVNYIVCSKKKSQKQTVDHL